MDNLVILKNIHIFTNEIKIIKILSKYFSIVKIFTENKELLKKISNKTKKAVLLNKKKKLKKIKIEANTDLAISYGFGIIFTADFIKKYPHGIWNIHPGDLPKYRGRHPITWAFLNDEKKVALSIHLINEKIDQGLLLGKYFVSRNYNDDEKTIKNKIFKIIPKTIRLAKKNYIKKSFKKLKIGKYYSPLFNGIKIKNSKSYDHKYIFNAIKAQKYYNGVKIGNKVFKDVIFFSKKEIKKKRIVLECKNKKKLIGIVK